MHSVLGVNCNINMEAPPGTRARLLDSFVPHFVTTNFYNIQGRTPGVGDWMLSFVLYQAIAFFSFTWPKMHTRNYAQIFAAQFTFRVMKPGKIEKVIFIVLSAPDSMCQMKFGSGIYRFLMKFGPGIYRCQMKFGLGIHRC